MAQYICEQCGGGFTRDKSGARPIRFCSQACYHNWRKAHNITGGQFKKGNIPWTKGRKGIHLSPDTEFKPGHNSKRKAPVGTVRVRTRKRDQRPRAFVKVAQPGTWKLRCRCVWERAYGPLPTGLVIHHLDRNTLNDNLTNLAAVSRAAHMKEHRDEREPARLRALRAAAEKRKRGDDQALFPAGHKDQK